MRKLRTEQRGQQTNSPASASENQPVRFDRRLIAGMDDQEVADFHARWKNSATVRQVVAGALTKELNNAILQAESGEALKSPNALAEVADNAAFRRALRLAIKLLSNQDDQ